MVLRMRGFPKIRTSRYYRSTMLGFGNVMELYLLEIAIFWNAR